MKEDNILYRQLYLAKESLFDLCNFELSDFVMEDESREYEACSFKLNDLRIRFRASKITPEKTGQFVTIWKRNKQNITAPFNQNDDFDFLIICSQDKNNFGLFIFSKTILADKGIITINNKDGKRGIRVYPNWNTVTNKQAEKTQRWQTKHFIDLRANEQPNLDSAKQLFGTS
ncbi:MepB family protein [Lacibacter luteus]|uniref:MepB family protein n=1 Tax=Lacibacter luteus TaxID=2508719 RepID=UPI00197C8CB1|nr:MepB family protein [Lacibacter luteus]